MLGKVREKWAREICVKFELERGRIVSCISFNSKKINIELNNILIGEWLSKLL